MYFNTTDSTTYLYDGGQWNKVASDGSVADAGFIDRRYSNDLENKTYTIDEDGQMSGIEKGKYLGLKIVAETPTIEELNQPGVFDTYAWSTITNDITFNASYLIEMDNQTISKFYEQDGTISCVPSQIELLFYEEINSNRAPIAEDENYYYTILCNSFDETNETYLVYTNEQGIETIYFPVRNQNNITFFDIKNLNLYDYMEVKLYQKTESVYTSLSTKRISIVYGMAEDMAKLSLNAGNITASIDNNKLVFNDQGLSIYNGGLTLYGSAFSDNDSIVYNKVLDLTDEGDLKIVGSITSSDGQIGGWIIEQNTLYSKNNNFYTGLHSGGQIAYNNNPVRLFAGQPMLSIPKDNAEYIIENNPGFIVTEDGSLYANNAEIKGSIYATSGAITNTFLIGDTNTAEDSFNGIVIYGGSQTGENYISSSRFSSGSQGYGWKITANGEAEFTNISARGKISSSVFEYSKVSSIGGSMYIAPTMFLPYESLSAEFDTDLNYYYFTWKLPDTDLSVNYYGRTWQLEDEVKLEGIFVADDTSYSISNIQATVDEITVQRNNNKVEYSLLTVRIKEADLYAGLGLNQEDNLININNGKFVEGSLLIFYGTYFTSGDSKILQKSGIYLTAADSGGPYIDIYDISDKTDYSPSVRLGNLIGIEDKRFTAEEASLSGYGLYSTNAYLSGQLMLPSAGITNQSNVVYNNSPVRIWAGANSINNISSANFIVTEDGSLYASKGVFKGVIQAVNSEFSGNILAAGIVIVDDGTAKNEGDALHNQFYVAYKKDSTLPMESFVPTYDNYILNIDKAGLSIWEGAFRAYSDAAKNSENGQIIGFNSIYGYNEDKEDASKNFINPLPYFYLVDSSSENNNVLAINSRAVTTKLHNFHLKETGEYTSVLMDGGIWFFNGQHNKTITNEEAKELIEVSAFNSVANKTDGISYNPSGLVIQSDNNINLVSKQGIIVKNSLEIVGESNKTLAVISIGNMQIQEIQSGTNDIGINIV